MQRNPAIRWGGEPCSSASLPRTEVAKYNRIGLQRRSGVRSLHLQAVLSWLFTTMLQALSDVNHVYAHSQHLTHRWRSFIPWMLSGIVRVFPFGRAIQSPASR